MGEGWGLGQGCWGANFRDNYNNNSNNISAEINFQLLFLIHYPFLRATRLCPQIVLHLKEGVNGVNRLAAKDEKYY